MLEFIADSIREIPVAQISPMEGPGFKPTPEAADALVSSTSWSEHSKKVLGTLFEDAGVKIGWVEQNGPFPKLTSEANAVVETKIDDRKVHVQEVYDSANEQLPGLKTELVDGLSGYGAALGFDGKAIAETFTKRIEAIDEVKVEDTLTQGKSYEKGGAAFFDNYDDTLRINVDSIERTSRIIGTTPAAQRRRDILHELMHAASFRAKAADLDYATRTGLSAMASYGESDVVKAWTGSLLLDEGAEEHIRWRHLDGTNPSYEKSVMFWEAAIALDPTIEVDRFNAKFFNKDRGVLIGKIENIFGPGAVEAIEDDMPSASRLRDYPDWKDSLVAMIDVYDADPSKRKTNTQLARQQARQVLDKVQLEIYGPRGMGYSDDELRYAKQSGGFLPNGEDINLAHPLNSAMADATSADS